MRESTIDIGGAPFFVRDAGEGPAVLFCHGFPDTGETWRRQMVAVAAAGYRAIALDMRGFGRSYAPRDPAQYSALHIAGDLVGVLDALDIRTAVLVGHDWGADHAQRAAILRPDRFRAVVSISIPFAPRGEQSHWQQLRAEGLGARYYAFGLMRDGLPPAAETIPSALYWLSSSPPPDERWDPIDPAKSLTRPSPVEIPEWADPGYVAHTIGAFARTGFDTGLNHYRAVQHTFDLMPAFAGALITQPSLYVWGADDGLCRFFHPETPTLEQLRQTQPGLVAQLRLDGVGHWVQHEAPEPLNTALIEFLEGLDAPYVPRDSRADINALEPRMGASALHKAVQSGDVKTLGLLLDRGAFVDLQSPVLGHTPLMDAVQYKQREAVALLLARGARTTPRNHYQESALDLAEDAGDLEIVRLIETRIADDARRVREAVLISAVKNHDEHAVRSLVAAGEDIDGLSPRIGGYDDDYTALGIAARDGDVTLVRVLLGLGADVRVRNGLMRATPAHEAAYGGHGDVLRVLTAPDAPAAAHRLELDAQGPYNGLTALHDAVWHGHVDAVRALVEAGAPLGLRTHAGQTPRELAEQYGYDEIVRLLADAERPG